MPNVLCFTIRFLHPDPTYHGKRDGAKPEWPPSPLRFFQALVDSAANRWRNSLFEEYAKPALEWLERLATPNIIAPTRHVGMPVRIAVPNNDLDVWAGPLAKGHVPKKQPAELKTMKEVRPTHLRGDAVHYLFPLTDGACPYLDVLSAAARSITHLGWGADMVAGNAAVLTDAEVAKLPGERWQLAEGSSADCLRVPRDGTLGKLAEKHVAFLGHLPDGGFRPVFPLSTSAYRVVGYRRATDPPGRAWAAFCIASLDPDDPNPAFDTPRRCRDVAAWVRNATDRVCNGWPFGDTASFVHGHDPADNTKQLTGEDADDRFMYLPLPSIEQRGDRGQHVGSIRRVLIAAPAKFAEQVEWVRRRLPGQVLVALDDRDMGMLTELSGTDWVLARYVGESRVWSTVTPVVMPGHDGGDPAKAERLLCKAFEHAGMPAELARSPELELTWRAVGFRPGVDLARRYRLAESATPMPTYHVRVRFPVSVRGPLAVGAGRYRGFGLFAAERSE